jgi:hypothetical protein
MAKPTTKPTAEPGAVVGAQLGRPPVPCDVTPEVWDRCRRDLHVKLARVITHGHETGDVGRISQLVADIRAMDLIEPTRRPPAPEPERVLSPEEQRIAAEQREQQEAAADPVKMRAYADKIARREAIEAEREDGGRA